jgi:glycosyltransferase involved in cell wall biosynthesis
MVKPSEILLLYTGSNGFPFGDAYTNRILSLGKGFISAGINVIILIIYPGRKNRVYSKTGIYDSVPYKYLTPLKTSRITVIKKIIGALGILNACFLITKYKRECTIISFAESSIQNVIISKCAHLKRIIFLREVNEFPRLLLEKEGQDLSVRENKKIKNSLKNLDGLICISKTLKDYFINSHSFEKPILVVPIVVDIKRFEESSLFKNERFISYCGNLFGEKDGVEILIKAFAGIAIKFKDYKLKLIGDTTNLTKFKKLKELVDSLKISESVIFTGYVNREEIPHHLINSDILVLARPDNLQARGGFPTKLGEYLATSKPVLVTSVGDIPEYIKDGINAFLVLPGNADSLAEKMAWIIQNFEVALKVGSEGRKLADKEFNPVYQAKRIVEFIGGIEKDFS